MCIGADFQFWVQGLKEVGTSGPPFPLSGSCETHDPGGGTNINFVRLICITCDPFQWRGGPGRDGGPGRADGQEYAAILL